MFIENYTDNFRKISIKPLLILLKNSQAVVQKTPRKNVTSSVSIFSSLLPFDGRHGWENHSQLKKYCTEIEKEETHAHRKRARSAVSRERTLWDNDAPQVGSARSDSTRVVKVNRLKTNPRKTRP